jgi:hypothetical protein
LFASTGVIGRSGKILGCRALVLLHDEQGHPRLATTSRGDQHLTAGLPKALARYEQAGGKTAQVLPLDMVENSISLSKPISGSFFRHGAVQKGHLLLEESSIRRLLLALSAISQDMLLQ